MRVTVVGPITRDIVMRVDELPPPSGSADAQELLVLAGGKGGNPAIAAVQLGAQVALVGAVGDDEAGDAALRELAALGIDVGAVARVADVPTGHIVHLVEPGGKRRYIEAVGANGHVHVDSLPAADVVLVSTALPRAAVEAASRSEGTVVLDVAGEPQTARGALPHVDVVRGDADEIGTLVGLSIDDFDSAVAAARGRLLAAGPRLAVVDARTDGNVFVSADEELQEAAAQEVSAIDPTGAGDALVTTLAVLLAHGRPLTDAAEAAVTAAAGDDGPAGRAARRMIFDVDAWTVTERGLHLDALGQVESVSRSPTGTSGCAGTWTRASRAAPRGTYVNGCFEAVAHDYANPLTASRGGPGGWSTSPTARSSGCGSTMSRSTCDDGTVLGHERGAGPARGVLRGRCDGGHPQAGRCGCAPSGSSRSSSARWPPSGTRWSRSGRHRGSWCSRSSR